MRHLLSILAATVVGLSASVAAAEGAHRRLARQPLAQDLPPDIPYRDPRPRFRAPPVASFPVRAYLPRPTYLPMFNEPPQPLR
ncbi:MAG TPA: hypothetical protein K8W01_10950 [Methylorubrum populi]|uniref:Uncharacterized protein n=1 Tax=Methylorubrum populi TaxID=223967 RepID=A0A921E290_9HYPH|nr:hypothetical protein [Methylorubrum populi]